VNKNLIEGEIWGRYRGKFALASGEETNNRENACEVYCPQDYYSMCIGFKEFG